MAEIRENLVKEVESVGSKELTGRRVLGEKHEERASTMSALASFYSVDEAGTAVMGIGGRAAFPASPRTLPSKGTLEKDHSRFLIL